MIAAVGPIVKLEQEKGEGAGPFSFSGHTQAHPLSLLGLGESLLLTLIPAVSGL